MYVVAHQMHFENLNFFALRQFVKHPAQLFVQHSEDTILSQLRYQHHAAFAVPSLVARALVPFYCESHVPWSRSENLRSPSYRSSLGESPTEPGAFLYELGYIASSVATERFISISSLTLELLNQADTADELVRRIDSALSTSDLETKIALAVTGQDKNHHSPMQPRQRQHHRKAY